ncbi:LOW QUALITY PROTEIN: inactive peptidyl-prolyl cis-trans isomerase FKBP6 [Chelonus insularis]|uniref:LOW QUALITY PROTEIN: inactive peptidyl-prolyl cis-trans isomerase FKBP6 n=1 Tax=Chelonus insularis TaxID=460826 RepID=UPI00158A9497|nr:LOW QUALITY PROTEIN: inactive peptidyl-prolyl cis-trans isomerase FKBP6 [Chelonus insularis]
MSQFIDPRAGFSLKDLMSDSGLVFDFGNEFEEEIEDDRYRYNPNVNMTEDELLSNINLELSENEDEDDDEPKQNASSLLGLDFDKLRDKMENLTSYDKIKKLVRQQGVGDVVPEDSMVTIKYSAYLEGQDEPYDSSFLRGAPDKFRLNRGELIVGLDLAIQSMRKHEVSIFLIHHDFAYGELGVLPLIPAKAEVLFIVYLIDFLDNGAIDTYGALDPEEKHMFVNAEKFAKHMMTTGADNFQKKQYKKAIRDYKKAIDCLQEAKLDNDEEEHRMNKLTSQAFQNLAVCYNKEDMPRKACIACNQVINKTAKTYFHYGRALIKMGEYTAALEKLEKALQMDPGNNEIVTEMRLASEFHSKNLAVEKAMWSNCLKLQNLEVNNTDNQYHEAAIEFCNNFKSNEHVLRQQLPEGISKDFKEAIRRQALAMGIKVTSHTKYNKENLYLEKPNYI